MTAVLKPIYHARYETLYNGNLHICNMYGPDEEDEQILPQDMESDPEEYPVEPEE